MIDLEIYTDKIADSGRKLIRKAYDEAKTRDHNQLAPEHVFISIAEIERQFFNEVMQSLNLDPLQKGHFVESIARLQEHLEKNVPWGARLTTTVVDAGEPTVLPAAGPAYQAARAALAEAWDGTTPVDMGTGGSIPFIAEFQQAFPGASMAE